jgi:hypothetical protein
VYENRTSLTRWTTRPCFPPLDLSVSACLSKQLVGVAGAFVESAIGLVFSRDMPITYTIDRASALITTIGSGHVTLTDVGDHFDELFAAWPLGMQLDVLLDLSDCTSLPDFQQLRKIASRIGQLGGPKRFGRCAIIATREVLYGMLRVFEVFADGKFAAVRVFRSQSEAVDWLRATDSSTV